MLMICALSGRARARVVRRYAVIAGQSLSDSVFELGLTGSSPGPHNDAHIKYTNSTFSRRFLRRARRLAAGAGAACAWRRRACWGVARVSRLGVSPARAAAHNCAPTPRRPGCRSPGVPVSPPSQQSAVRRRIREIRRDRIHVGAYGL